MKTTTFFQKTNRAIKRFLLLIFLIIGTYSISNGQLIQLSLSVNTSQSLKNLNDLQTLVGTGGVSLTITNLTNQPQEFVYDIVMQSGTTGFKIISNPDDIVEGDLEPNETKILSQAILQDLFYEESLITNEGITVKNYAENDRNGGVVPEGMYQLCVQLRVKTLNQQLTNSLSNLGCGTLQFQQYSQPIISSINFIQCTGFCEIPVLPSLNTPLPIAFTAPTFGLTNVGNNSFTYNIKIFKLLEGDDPNQDFQALSSSLENRFVYNHEVIGTEIGGLILEQLLKESFTEALIEGHQYGVVVQALSFNRDIIPNDGYSPIVVFRYGIGGLTEAIKPNDPNLPCYCSSNCDPIYPKNTDGAEVSKLEKGAQVLIGCFIVTLDNEINTQSGKFSGKGTVNLPYFAAKFQVGLNNLVVRNIDGKLVVISGKAIGLNNNDASPAAKEAYAAFMKAKGVVLSSTGDITEAIISANQTVQSGGSAINSGAEEIVSTMEQAKYPPGMMEVIYKEQGALNENVSSVTSISRDITAGAIFINNTLNDAANTAESIFKVGMRLERFAEQVLNENFVTGLPIGIKMGDGDAELRAGVFGMVFTPEKATIDLLIETPIIPAINNRLYFGANNIAITTSDFSIGNTTFYLGGSIIFGLPGGHAIKLKGTGTDGTANTGTFLTLNNHNLDKLQLQGDFIFSKDLFEPSNGNGNVTASIDFEIKDNFDDVIFDLTTDKQFRLASNKMFDFKLKEFSLDFSINSNNELNKKAPTWKGIYMKEMALLLPTDFKIGSGRVEANIQNLYIPFDSDAGLSFDAKVSPVLNLDDGGLGIFGFSIDSLYAKMENNNLENLGLKGKIKVGLFDNPIAYHLPLTELFNENKTNTNGALPPIALKFIVAADIPLTINAMHTTFTIGADSYIAYNSGGFDGEQGKNLQFLLNGKITVKSQSDGIELPEMEFNDFFFNGRDIDKDRFNIKFASPQKFIGVMSKDGEAGGFPISLTGFHPIFETENGQLRFGMGFDVILNLMEKAGFGLTTGIELSVALGDKLTPEPSSFKFGFNKISIQADIAIAKVSGELEFLKDETWGSGFRGCVRIEMTKPAPIIGQVQAIFGSKGEGSGSFRYFFVEGLIQGINVLIPSTPIALDGFAGGLWYNMKESGTQNTATRLNGPATGCQAPNLEPSSGDMGIYFGVMFKEAASQGFAFNGMMVFKATLTTDFEPITIGISGAANFVQMPKTPSDPSMKVAGDLELVYDFDKNVFSGELNIYLNVGEVLKGRGENDLAGRMVMYFGENDWYIFLGNPWGHANDPGGKFTSGEPEYIGINMGLEDVGEFSANMYFCMGTWGISGLPPLPSSLGIPEEFRTRLNGNRPILDANASNGGIAFGLNASFDFMENLAGFSAEAAFGFGFDLALVQYSEGISCKDYSGSFGINGAYATGQIYGYATASISVRIPREILEIVEEIDFLITDEIMEVLRRKHTKDLGELYVSASFGGPNPTWIEGEIIVSSNALETVVDIIANSLSGGSYSAINTAYEGIDYLIDTDERWGRRDKVTDLTEDLVEFFFEDGVNIQFSLGDKCTPDNTENPTNRAQNNAINDRMGSNSIVSYISPMVGNGNIRSMELNEPIKVILNKPIEQEWSVSIKLSNGNTAVRRRRWKVYKEDLSIKLHGNRKSISFTKSIVSPTEINYYLNNPSQIVT